MKNFKFLLSFLFFASFLAIPTLCSANPDPGCNPDEPCPIDSEVYLLIIGAILFAGYKYVKSHKNKLAIKL